MSNEKFAIIVLAMAIGSIALVTLGWNLGKHAGQSVGREAVFSECQDLERTRHGEYVMICQVAKKP